MTRLTSGHPSRIREAKTKSSFLVSRIQAAYSYELSTSSGLTAPVKALVAAIRAYLSGVRELLRADYRRTP